MILKQEKDFLTDRWDSDTFKNKEIALTIFNETKFLIKYIPSPFSGHRPLPNQKFSTIETNEKGWRSPSLKKLRFKKNIVLLGGSAAWGFGATSNQNIPSYLIEETLLKKYKLEYNVINLAEQMYTSFEELQSFVSYADELNPSAVICLSGFNDCAQSHHDIFKINILQKRWINFCLWGLKIGILNENSFLKKIVKIILRSFKKTVTLDDDYYIYKKPKKTDIATNLFENKITWITSYCKAKKIPVAFFLQPDLHFKKNKSAHEKNYLKTFDFTNPSKTYKPEKSNAIINGFLDLEKKFFNNNSTDNTELFYSLLNVFDDFEETIFIDRVHFSDKGNKVVAEKICSELIKSFKI